MSDLLPSQPPLRLIQSVGAIGKKALAAVDHLLVVLPHAAGAAAWKSVPDGERLRRQWRELGPDPEQPLRTRLAGPAATGVTLSCAPKALGRAHAQAADSKTVRKTDQNADESAAGNMANASGRFPLLKLAGELMAAALTAQPRRVGIVVAGFDERTANELAQALVLAAGAAAFRLPDYRKKPARAPRLQQLHLLGLRGKLDAARLLAEIEAGNLVRWLTSLPPNKLTATSYRAVLAELTEHHDWSMRFLDTAALKRLGAGAFLAVAQGNATGDAGIVHLSWRPQGRGKPDVALVGKGIIFDTGGTNLKPFRAMLDMHQDMAGSATALGVLLAITRLKLPLAVDCWLAITENRIGPLAYKSRDIVRAADGTTIEVIHTDAEGRMVLADALALAGREKPGLVIDYATLTGACINALTDRYSGVFTNRPALNALLWEAGRDSGERVWPFPMDDDYEEDIASSVADVAQCSVENEGDHILAARFLQRFVAKDTPWVHVDLASATRRKGLGQVPAGPTGFGVRLTLNLLIERAAALATATGAHTHD